MVSLIQSNYRGMGSGMIPPGLGFMLQDRGELFSLEEGHFNVYEPQKRPFHTIIPAFITKDNKPYVSFGLMGGAMQPQGHAQIVINLIDFEMNFGGCCELQPPVFEITSTRIKLKLQRWQNCTANNISPTSQRHRT